MSEPTTLVLKAVSAVVTRALRRHYGIGPLTPARIRGWQQPRPPFVPKRSMPGGFPAGDVRLECMKRVAPTAGQGAMQAYLLYRYLATI